VISSPTIPGLGFTGGALLIGSLIALTALASRIKGINRVILFWIAFVLTRPFGATFGDLLTKPLEKGGLGFGTVGSSLVLFTILATLVALPMLQRKRSQPASAPSSPIHRQRRAGNLRRCVRGQEHHHLSQLLGRHELQRRLLFSQQRTRGGLLIRAFALGQRGDLLLDQRRPHPARADRIGGDAGARILQRGHLGEPHHAMLGRHIGRLVHRAHQPVHRRDVDDAAGALLLHVRQGRRRCMEHRREIQRQDRIPLLDGNSSIDAVCWMPALFTRMSMRPIVATAWSIIPRTASPRDRSAPSCATRTPNSASSLERMRSISAASPKPFSTMSAPCRASAVAMPRPIPLVEPVTTATFPLNMGELPLGVGGQCRLAGARFSDATLVN
jgi:hypothetical protein